jgi:hypothetical protein
MNSVSSFQECLLEVVNQNTLNQENWRSENWQKPWPLIDQEVLNDAFGKHDLIQSLFVDLGEIIPRNCKSLARVNQKKTEQKYVNYFKVVSDLVAGRVHCNVNEIQSKIDCIRKVVLENNGQMHIKGSSNECPYGSFMNADKKFTDIAQYVYVFMEKVGYPIEFQIGHEFASHTFTIDSALRDNRDCGKVDLWDKDFYAKVKNYILAKANTQNPGSKEEINSICAEIHKDNVPSELQQILEKI